MTGIPKRMVQDVLQRDGWICQLNLDGCLREATVADHRANRGMGGSPKLNNVVNLIAACGVCNGAKESASNVEKLSLEERGLRVLHARTADGTVQRAAETPVKYRHGDWYKLRPDGGRTIIRGN